MPSNLFSDIRIFPVNSSTIKANGKMVIAGTVEVSFKVIQGKNGMFVALPQTKTPSKVAGEPDKYWADVRILDEETKKQMEETVLAAFNAAGTGGSKTTSAPKKSALPF